MRRVDKEIYKTEYEEDLGKAITLAEKMGYYVTVYDGDGESGPCAPVITGMYKSRDHYNSYMDFINGQDISEEVGIW